MRMTRSASTRFKAWNTRPGSHDAALAMLQCNLLCTGVTRGKRLVDADSTEETVGVAVRNVSGRRLWSTGQSSLKFPIVDVLVAERRVLIPPFPGSNPGAPANVSHTKSIT
jgi:hypothetical protein